MHSPFVVVSLLLGCAVCATLCGFAIDRVVQFRRYQLKDDKRENQTIVIIFGCLAFMFSAIYVVGVASMIFR